MHNPEISDLILAEQPEQQALYADFSIDLAPNTLLLLMQQYQLKAIDVSGLYHVNLAAINHFIATELNSELSMQAIVQPENLTQIIKTWPEQLSWAQFYAQINNFLAAWLNDYMKGVNYDMAMLMTNCIKLSTSNTEATALTKHSHFQQLLMHLMARVANQFDQYKFDYWQHFNMESGLPNQQLLLKMLDQMMLQHQLQTQLIGQKNANQAEQQLGIILINLNINIDEAFRLNTTSSVLIDATIQMVKSQLNDEAILFHVSPDELAILVRSLNYPLQLHLIITKLMHAFEYELPLEKITLILTPYFGAASTFNPDSNSTLLYEHARLALHHAMKKETPMQIYEEHLTSTFIDNHLLEEAIISALQQNELATFLQPIVSIEHELCLTAEVLLRWPNKQWPTISPAMLIDTIYKKGFGKVFIRWLINNACQRCAALLFEHKRSILLTINVGVTDLLDPDLPELIAQAIMLWEIPAENLVFEITESDLLSDETRVNAVIDEIKTLGCQIALDDFGTGYSSMARLRNMPVDFVKIDQSFVRNMLKSNQDLEIVQSIIKLAHSLGKQVVCEGVEDIGIVNILKEMHCEKIQGYYYSKPLAFDVFIEWLQEFELSQHQKIIASSV